jgi:transposase-like protein/IS1 family transposase
MSLSFLREALPWLLVIILVSQLIGKRYKKQLKAFVEEQKAKRPWSLNPKTPKDCPACVEKVGLRRVNPGPAELPAPWETVKGAGGPRKMVETEGYCCDDPACRYYRNRDASVHALVGSGVRGASDAIQRLLCQACGNRFSVRRDTALRDLKTEPERIALAMNLAAEGVCNAVIARALGHGEETIARWLERSGRQASLLHDRYFYDLELAYVQVDELQSKIRAYPGEKAWLWAAIDPQTKIVPTLTLSIGGRKTIHAMVFIHDLVLRLAEGWVPLFTSDGLRQYFWALTAHFGRWIRPPRKRVLHWEVDEQLHYGQLIKKRKGRRLQTIRTQIMCGTRPETVETLAALGHSSTINTSFIERFNLTLRHLVAALVRRTSALAQTEQTMMQRLEWSRACYHFVRIHSSLSLGQELPRALRERTPAMAAGLTDRRWRTLDILRLPLVAPGGV